MVQEAVGAEKTPGEFAQKTRTATATPSVKAPGIAAGFGQFASGIEAPAEHQL